MQTRQLRRRSTAFVAHTALVLALFTGWGRWEMQKFAPLAAISPTEKAVSEGEDVARIPAHETARMEMSDVSLSIIEKAKIAAVARLLDDAEQNVLNLQYDYALEKLRAAAQMGIQKPEVAQSLLEMAFWHGETGDAERATEILHTVAALTDRTALPRMLRKMPGEPEADRALLRKAMNIFFPTHYQYLFEKKYYPEMVEVEGGVFYMGCNSTVDRNCEEDEKRHRREVGSFLMAKHELTFWQFALYCKAEGLNIEHFLVEKWDNPGDNPAVNISWSAAVDYLNWLSRQKNKTEAITRDENGKYNMQLRSGYRLPTEAEWEYAARERLQNLKGVYAGRRNIDAGAWYYQNSGGRTRSVTGRQPNSLGLYQMSGNVWEWCWDWYGVYEKSPVKDFMGPPEGLRRVIRGGSWFNFKVSCRSTNRNCTLPSNRNVVIGVRPVLG